MCCIAYCPLPSYVAMVITFNNCIPSFLPRGAASQSRPHSLMHILFILRGQKLTNIFIPSSAAYDSINSGTKYLALVFSSFTAIQAAHPESELIFPFRAFYTFPFCVYMKNDFYCLIRYGYMFRFSACLYNFY